MERAVLWAAPSGRTDQASAMTPGERGFRPAEFLVRVSGARHIPASLRVSLPTEPLIKRGFV